MKTRKDLIFHIIWVVWLTLNLMSFVFLGEAGVVISNLACIAIVGGIVRAKVKDRKFGLWLEEPLIKE